MSQGGGATRIAAAALLRAAARGEPFGGPSLLVHDGGGEPRRVPLAGELTVGRGAAAELQLGDAGVSRLHARFRVGPDGEATVEDLGSKNGVRWNGRRVAGAPCRLRPGDTVEIGRTTLVYSDPLVDPLAGPAPAGGDERAGPLEAVAAAEPADGHDSMGTAPAARRWPPGALLATGAVLLAVAGALLLVA